jgi:hypothetical protein
MFEEPIHPSIRLKAAALLVEFESLRRELHARLNQ